MKEIVSLEQVNALFLALAVAAPVLGVAIGGALGMRRGAFARSAMTGLLWGLLGPANLALWKLYGSLTDRMGLDTVRNLLTQLGLFLAIGVVAGVVIGRLSRQPDSDRDDSAAPPEA